MITMQQSDMKVVTRYYIDITPEQLRHVANQIESASATAFKGQELTLDLNDVFSIRCAADCASASKRPAPTRIALTKEGQLRTLPEESVAVEQ